MKIAAYVLGVIVLAILFEKVISNINLIGVNSKVFFKAFAKATAPFIYALAIAYLTNPLMRFIDTKVLGKWKPPAKLHGFKRSISIFAAYIVFFGVIAAVFAFILPEILISLRTLVAYLIKIIPQRQAELLSFLETQEYIPRDDINAAIQTAFAPFQNLSSLGNIINTLIISTMSFASGLLNFLLGIVVSFYILKNKEGFANYLKKLTFLIFNPNQAVSIINGFKEANKIFEGFFVGKAIDSTIIGILCFIMLSLMKADYVLLSSVIVGVTNMIPYFGPFIGAVPVVFITLLYDPILAMWVALAIFALQQFDGSILGPKILGESTGLSPIWVIFAIIIGGALMGPLGMLLGVPTVAVIKSLLDSFIDKKFKAKYPELPTEPELEE